MIFDNTIAYIVTALRHCDPGREQVGVNVWYAGDTWVLFYRLQIGNGLKSTEKIGEGKIQESRPWENWCIGEV